MINSFTSSLSTSIVLPEPIIMKYCSLVEGRLTCLNGFVWDGATGVPDTPENRTPSMWHDAIIGMIQAGKLDKKYAKLAHKIYRESLIRHGSSKLNAWFNYIGLMLFGWIWLWKK